MSDPTHEGQQCAVHMVLGFIPVLRVRFARPAYYGGWEWGPWRFAKVAEAVTINAVLMAGWRK
jgi:hypothetical protein